MTDQKTAQERALILWSLSLHGCYEAWFIWSVAPAQWQRPAPWLRGNLWFDVGTNTLAATLAWNQRFLAALAEGCGNWRMFNPILETVPIATSYLFLSKSCRLLKSAKQTLLVRDSKGSNCPWVEATALSCLRSNVHESQTWSNKHSSWYNWGQRGQQSRRYESGRVDELIFDSCCIWPWLTFGAPGGISCEREWHHPQRKAHGPLPGEVLSGSFSSTLFWRIAKPHLWVWVPYVSLDPRRNSPAMTGIGGLGMAQRASLTFQVHLADLALQLEGGRRKGLSQAQRRGRGHGSPRWPQLGGEKKATSAG